jgi:DeoR/GlpR family transcriptional regulator of sugar metabolism
MTDQQTDGERMAPAERRDRVRRHVIDAGFSRIDDLAKSFGISLMTVHRDLDALQEQGWLTKIRGGATANPSALTQAGVVQRVTTMGREKEQIAAAAARHLGTGQTVFIDDSTTALALLPHLIAAAPITVATNFLPAVRELGTVSGVEVIALGGAYYPLQEACFGLATVDAIRRLHADVLFMSTTAVNRGLCLHRSEITVMVKQAFIASAARTVLLADHAKFGRPAPHLLCPVDAFDLVVVDAGIDGEELDELRMRDVVVEVAEP